MPRFFLAAALLFAAVPAAAQPCAGIPIGPGEAAASAGVGRSDGITGWSAGAAWRPAAALALDASGTRWDYDDAEVSLWQVAAGGAWSAEAAGWSICPRATVAYAWPDDDSFEIDAWTGAARVAAGRAWPIGGLEAIGFASAGIAATRASVGAVADTEADAVAGLGATLAGSRLYGTVSLEVTSAEAVDPTLGVAIGVRLW